MGQRSILTVWFLTFLLWGSATYADNEPICQLQDLSAQQLRTLEPAGDHFRIQLENGLSFRLSSEPPAESREEFSRLTAKEKREFFRRRYELLKTAAKTLGFPRLAGGFAIARDKIKACLGKENKSVADRLANMTSGARGAEVIAHSLQAFDRLIWEDASVLVKSKMVSFAVYVGAGSGLAVWNFGYYVNGGVQMDIGYNFETQKRFVQFSWVKQRLKGAIFCFEQLLGLGLLRQYQLEPTIETHEATAYTLPLGLNYRRGDTMVASGMTFGVQAADVGSALLAAGGDVGMAGALVVGSRVLSSLSLYWTDMTKKQVYRREFETRFHERIKSAWKRWLGNSCEDNLSQRP